MPTLAALTIYAFGFSAFIFGTLHLVSPTSATHALKLPDTCIPAINGECTLYKSSNFYSQFKLTLPRGNALAAMAMGIYYSLAAYQENRAFFYLTVPMRLLTSVVFWGQRGGWRMASVWEGGCAIVTALALKLE